MKKAKNQLLVIFGASGDLTSRKLIPSIFNLFKQNLLPEHFKVLGIGRTAFSPVDYRQKTILESTFLKESDPNVLQRFSEIVDYISIDTAQTEDYQKLSEYIENYGKVTGGEVNTVFYLSTPPKLYHIISESLAYFGLHHQENGHKRIIVEKPFGYDLKSAKKLNDDLKKYFNESQIYRIDHYLGKETVQNLLVTRFANTIYEPLWNRNFIHRVEITAAETVGIEKRGGYYEESGALRDMVQNHLLQLVALVAMEPPSRIDATSIRNEKAKIFQSLRPLSQEKIQSDVIRGQYIASHIKGELYKGYREETGVNPHSRTETFVAMKFFIDNWRWAEVPFYIRTGKRLPTRVSEVVIHFKPNHHHLFKKSTDINNQNILVFRIQPNEGILLKFGLKTPGSGFDVHPVNMGFHYHELTEKYVPDAYERLLLDCMQGDATLFARGDSVEAAWDFVDPILENWANNPKIPIYGYPSGTWGPEHVDQLIDGENMAWRYPCKNLNDDGKFCEL